MEEISKSPVPIIGSYEFEFTIKDVKKASEEIEKGFKDWQNALTDKDERIREFAQKTIQKNQIRNQTLSAPPEEILKQLQTFYNRTIELGNSGMDENAIALQIADEFPDFINFYTLLRMKPWGYKLGQTIMAALTNRANEQEKERSNKE